MFNAEVLDKELELKTKFSGDVILSTADIPVTFKGGSDWTYKAAAKGGAVLDKVSIGKCIAYPASLEGCNNVNEYLNERRSKGVSGLGLYSSGYKRQCWAPNTKYYNYIVCYLFHLISGETSVVLSVTIVPVEAVNNAR